METKFVEIRKSELTGAGEGLFLIKDVEANEIIAFFNGVRVTIEDANKLPVHRESSHKIWNDWNDQDEMLDITPEYRCQYFFLWYNRSEYSCPVLLSLPGTQSNDHISCTTTPHMIFGVT